MSAVTGIFLNHGRSVDPELIKSMNDMLSHRGPDGSSIWYEGPIAFGHLMLYTTPESLNEKLPFFNEKNSLAITADARIDNRSELIRDLGLEKSKELITDSQLILKSYEKWGEKCPEKLLGDFSFAIWDQNKGTLFCARDHMGVKPFYYYLSDNGFYFATEIKALLREISPKINEVKVADYLISMDEDRKNTFYQDIFRLPAAHTLNIDFKNNDLKQYWSLDPKRELNLGSDEEYAETFHEIFEEAVNCRLRSAYSVGSELSGGLDSSSVACTAQTLLSNEKQQLKTFSIVFHDLPECDESYYSKIVSKWMDFDSHFIKGDGINPFEVMDNTLWPNEGPQSAHSMYVFWSLYKKAQEKDVRVILNGFEGDATVGKGFCLLHELARKRKFRTLINEIKGRSSLMNLNPYKLFFFEVIGPMTPEFLRRIWRFFFNRDFLYHSDEKNFINEDFAKRIDLLKRYEILNEYFHKKGKSSRDNHYYELSSGLYQSVLEELDKTAAVFNIEFRYPFMDRRLLEFCLALPPEQQLFNGWDRIVMRRAMEGILPPEIQWRRNKTFFDANFNLNLLKFGKGELKSMMQMNNNSTGKYIDLNAINGLFDKLKSKSYESVDMGNEPYLLWKAINLHLWLLRNGL